MTHLDNPAGRLHGLLTRLLDEPNRSVAAAWAAVLAVQADDLEVSLWSVALLLRDLDAAVAESRSEPMKATLRRYRDSWSKPIFPRDVAYSTPVHGVAPRAASLEALELLSEYLHTTAAEGAIPDADQVADLAQRVREVREDVGAATDLTEDIRRLLQQRLTAVLSALEHLEVGGPEAVRLATAALVGGAVIQSPGGQGGETWTKVALVLGLVWTAFSSGPAVNASLSAWEAIGQRALPSGPAHSAPAASRQDVTDAPQ